MLMWLFLRIIAIFALPASSNNGSGKAVAALRELTRSILGNLIK